MSIRNLAATILDEQRQVLTALDEAQAAALLAEIRAAGRVFVLGEGRSGLVVRMLAMRLMHLGYTVHVVGETTAPAIAPGDLLVACSGSGETDVTCLLAEKAVATGARLAAITAAPNSRLARAAQTVVALPTPHKRGDGAIDSVQYGGSLFEQSALLLAEAMVLALMPATASETRFSELSARHANLE
jgi:6-phospho-3-hexuloisomerase